jgi:NADP-dependent 3-hydroxy acid dehydrogenase YdfG
VSNPVVIIVGAGEGLGMATARRFAGAGYDIGLIARNAERTEQLAKQLSDEGAQVGWASADSGNSEELTAVLNRMTAHTERLDVLLYNVSTYRAASSLEISAADLLTDLQIGAAGLLTAVRAVLPILRQQHTGTILATGGGSADRPFSGAATLGVQKAALRALVQALAKDLQPEGVHVATVTINGTIKEGTPFAPDRIAELYWELVQETAADPQTWRTVVPLNKPS